jgi:hypothetical protein
MEQYYYLDINGQQQGPISPSEFRQYGVTYSTKVWKQGMRDWEIAGFVPELRNANFSKAVEGGRKYSNSETAFFGGMIILQIIGTVILVGIGIWLISLSFSRWGTILALMVLVGIGKWIWGFDN